MWALATPLRTAYTQLCTLGIMPPSNDPVSSMEANSSTAMVEMSDPGSATSRRSPSMLVRYTSFSACSAAAMAPAAVSALMLYA